MASIQSTLPSQTSKHQQVILLGSGNAKGRPALNYLAKITSSGATNVLVSYVYQFELELNDEMLVDEDINIDVSGLWLDNIQIVDEASTKPVYVVSPMWILSDVSVDLTLNPPPYFSEKFLRAHCLAMGTKYDHNQTFMSSSRYKKVYLILVDVRHSLSPDTLQDISVSDQCAGIVRLKKVHS